jgi:DnaJ-domain-containing protein 1
MGFDEEGNIIPGSPADKIDKAYTNQWNNSNKDITAAKYWKNEFVKKGRNTVRVKQT